MFYPPFDTKQVKFFLFIKLKSAILIKLSDNAKGRVAGMVKLRQIVNELIQQQLNDFPDEDIKASQAKLNATYDAFTAKYGLINDKKNARLFDDDSSYYLLCSLENLDVRPYRTHRR